MEQHTSQQPPSAAQPPPVLNHSYTHHPPPRVPVTGSMFFAYAAMRGNIDKGSHEPDPLHSSLYQNPIQFVKPQFELPINLPRWQRQNDHYMSQELPHGSIFFHDVSGPMYLNPAPPQRPLRGDDFREMPLSYDDCKCQSPPVCPSNHYKGEEAYGNFGYLQVNGHWVDPDSLKEVDDAMGDRAPHDSKLPPEIVPSPCLYEEEIYKEFIAEVNDVGGDGEGDPRATYVTPATFARWAAGAAKGDSYSEAKVPPQDPPLRELCRRTRTPKPPPPQPRFQYCEVTGSVFSGEYSPESNPSLCMSSRGVDMTIQPGNFSLSYPQRAIDFDRAAFSGGNPNDKSKAKVADWLGIASSTASTPMTFTEDNAIKHLADPKDTDPNAGVKRWNEHVNCVNSLHREFRSDLLRSVEKHNRRFEGLAEAQEIYKEAYFMETRLNKRDVQMGTPTPRRSIARDSSRPTHSKPPQINFRQADETSPTRAPSRKTTRDPHTEAAAELYSLPPHPEYSSRECYPAAAAESSTKHNHTTSSSLPSPTPSSPQGTPPQLLRRKNQFERYLMERQERERINVNKQKMTNAHLDVAVKDIRESIQELKVIHTKYRTSLGAKSVSEILDLFPQRNKTPDPKEEVENKKQLETEK